MPSLIAFRNWYVVQVGKHWCLRHADGSTAWISAEDAARYLAKGMRRGT